MSTIFEKEFAEVQPMRRKPPPNKYFHARFLAALSVAGLSQQQLADALGIDKSTVWRWVEGLTQPAASLWPGLARELKVSVGHLFGQAPEKVQEERTPSVPPLPKNLRQIPLVGAAAAGEAMAKLTAANDIPWLSFSEDFLQPMFRGRMDRERAVLMRVEGDSMEGDLPNGALVFIDRGPAGEGITETNEEDIYLVQPPDEEGLTLKRVSVQGRGHSRIIMLMPSGLALSRYRVKPYSLAPDTGITIQSIVRGKVVGRFEYVGRSAPTAK